MADQHITLDAEARGHLGLIRRRIAGELIARGMSQADAEATVSTHKLGDGTLLKLILQYGPSIYALTTAILKLFGITLPPLPPIPTPAPTA